MTYKEFLARKKGGYAVVLVDLADEQMLKGAGRLEIRGGYVLVRWGRRQTEGLHRYLTKAPAGSVVDHVNGDPLDNRRCNLRVCTSHQNHFNVPKPRHNTSGFKGVSWKRSRRPWHAHIQHHGKKIHIGCFATREGAAEAYNDRARILFGEFARLNEL
jgi:hypothetical protein